MGCTKTICQCRGPAILFSLDEVREHQSEIKSRMEHYLKSELYESPPIDLDSTLIDEYADAFLILASHYPSGKNDFDRLICHLLARAGLFHSMWELACSAKSEILLRDDMYSVFQTSVDVPVPRPILDRIGHDQESVLGTRDYADILARGLKKIFREYQIALASEKTSRIKHQTALLGDLLDEMQDFFHYMDLLGVRDIGSEKNVGS